MICISVKNDFLMDAEQFERMRLVIKRASPGRCRIDETDAKPLPSGYTAQRWGVRIKRADGSIVIEPDPREA
jgi:hypothetical protein